MRALFLARRQKVNGSIFHEIPMTLSILNNVTQLGNGIQLRLVLNLVVLQAQSAVRVRGFA
jgi:hypothetical protein